MVTIFNGWITLCRLNWNAAFAQRKNFGLLFALNFAVCFALYMLITRFVYYNRLRSGVILHDPIMALFTPMDLSRPIFFFLYSGILLFLYHVIPRAQTFVPAVRAFLLLFAVRAAFIYLVPLAPPADLVVLRDPFVDNIIGFKNEVINDLFFSGHVADLSFFVFCCTDKKIRNYLILSAVAVGIMLLIQRAHYTADVLAAPVFSFFCYTVFVKPYVVD